MQQVSPYGENQMLHACRLQYARRVGQLPVADRALLALAGRCGRCESQHLGCRTEGFLGVATVLLLCCGSAGLEARQTLTAVWSTQL